jgi:hypothetical protein
MARFPWYLEPAEEGGYIVFALVFPGCVTQVKYEQPHWPCSRTPSVAVRRLQPTANWTCGIWCGHGFRSSPRAESFPGAVGDR